LFPLPGEDAEAREQSPDSSRWHTVEAREQSTQYQVLIFKLHFVARSGRVVILGEIGVY
jgi:hypothetical protein